MLDIPNRHTAVQTSCRNRTQGRYMYSFYSLQINSSQFNGAKIIKTVAHRQHFFKINMNYPLESCKYLVCVFLRVRRAYNCPADHADYHTFFLQDLKR